MSSLDFGPALPDNAPRPRLCHVTKWTSFDGYGFNLHAEKTKPGQYIGQVDVGSPAEAAGLREGDRIVEVNGVNINHENHKQVVQRIKAVPDETRLLVVDLETERYFRQNEIIITGQLSNIEVLSSADHEDEVDEVLGTSHHRHHQHQTKVEAELHHLDMDIMERRSNGSMASSGVSSDKTTGTSRPDDDESDEHSDDSSHLNSYSPLSKTIDEGVLHFDSETDDDHVTKIETTTTPQKKQGDDDDEQPVALVVARPSRKKSDKTKTMTTTATKTKTKKEKAFGSSSTSGSTPRSTPSPEPANNNSSSLSSVKKQSHNWDGLNLNMTAAEMREKLSSRKKRDPRKDDRMDFRKKYEIIDML